MAFKKFTASAETLVPDPVYNSKLVSKVINCFMTGGRKFAAQGIVYGAMEIIGQKIKDTPPIEVFEKAIDNIKPMIEVRSKRVGGANYQVPMQVNSKRQLSLAIRWVRDAVRSGKGQPARFDWQMNFSPHTRARALQCRPAKTCTAWPRRTRHSPTSRGNDKSFFP